LKTRARKVLGD